MNKKYILLAIVLLLVSIPSVYSFRFIAWADTKSHRNELAQLSREIKSQGLNPAFTIYPGDLESDGPTRSGLNAWKDAVNGYENNGMWDITFPTRGNHDARSNEGSSCGTSNIHLNCWREHFNLRATATRVGASNYVENAEDTLYSFDYGNSRFIGLDVVGGLSAIRSADLNFLDSRLADAESRGLTHAFIYLHGPIYCLDGHCGCTSRGCVEAGSDVVAIMNIFNKYPDLVSATFHGHEHVTAYVHIDSTRITNTNVGYEWEEFVVGDAGAGTKPCNANRYDYCMSCETGTCVDPDHGYAVVDVNGPSFTVSLYGTGGSYGTGKPNPRWTKTFTKTGTVPLPACTEADWSYSDGGCQPDNTLTRTWTKIGTCQGGVSHPATQTFSCTYVPVCGNGACETGETTSSCPSDCLNIIIDYGDLGYVENGPDWGESSYSGGYGGSSRLSICRTPGDYADWSTSIPQSGQWNIYAWWTSGETEGKTGRITDAKYEIYKNNQRMATVVKNQQINGAKFNLLGIFVFSQNDIAKVRLLDTSNTRCGGSGDHDSVSADAVKFSYQTSTSNNKADVNRDGFVNMEDIRIVVANFLKSIFDPAADVNDDASVNLFDIVVVARNYGQTGTPVCGDHYCNGDEACSSCEQDCGPCTVPCQDFDNDNYGVGDTSGCPYSQQDCDDNNQNINPSAAEICGNGVDENCDSIDPPCIAGLPVVPGGVGFGMETRAAYGKSGTNPVIYKVTNIASSGSGSLTNCMESSGPRVCIFEVSGTINLGGKISVNDPYLTVAGQTAPSPGITLKGAPIEIKTHDVLIQHIRVRPGSDSSVSASNLDAIGITGDRISNPEASNVYNIVLDHVSLSWAVDEVLQLYYAVHDISVTNSIISEGLDDAGHPDGPHSKGMIIGENAHDITVYNNVFAHNYRRNPVMKRNTRTIVVNNVIHNWGEMGIHIPDWDTGGPQLSSIIGNVFSRGVDSNSNMIYIYSGIDPSSQIYLEDNKEYSGASYSAATVKNGEGSHVIASSKPVWNNGLAVKSSGSVRDYVLNNAGARPADRDAVDIRIANEVRTGGGRIIDNPSEVGGWPNLAQNNRPLTVPSNPHGDNDGDGYTNLEEWLHGYSAQVE